MASRLAVSPETQNPSVGRPVVYRSRGNSHGPITRLMSPGDLGKLIKPFIFLDRFETENFEGRGFAPHPHSGIATVTIFLEGSSTYADSTGQSGSLSAGSVEWMRAGSGVWHAGDFVQGIAIRGYQLWIALPPKLELASPESLYLEPASIETVGPARVILGNYEGKSSAIPLPMPMTYLHVQLEDGERWTYQPAVDHTIAWFAVNSGKVYASGSVFEQEIAVFAEGDEPIDIIAEGKVELVIGSAVKHPHPLVSGYYSVHTNPDALIQGESNIAELENTAAVRALHSPK